MSKGMGKGKVYIIGKDGICHVKIGVTAGKTANKRLWQIRSQCKDQKLEVLHTTDHSEAWLLEKLVHIYLSQVRSNGEWFDIYPEQAIIAVNRTVEVLAGHRRNPMVQPTWFEKCGIPPDRAAKFLQGCPVRITN